jgi:hypothetical protein
MMDGLIFLSEIARNITLPVVAILGALIAYWQAQMGKRRNGNDLVAKAAELVASANAKTKLAAYALLLEAISNSASREMASRLFLTYIGEEEDVEILQNLRRLTQGTTLSETVASRLKAVDLASDQGRDQV